MESQKAEKEYKNQVEEFQKHKYAQQQLENIASFQKIEEEILAQKAAERQAIKDFNLQVFKFHLISPQKFFSASKRKKTTRSRKRTKRTAR